MAVAFNILRKWSWARDKTNTNNVKWADTPSISLKQWTDAYQWQQNIKIFKNPDVENKYYFKLVLVLEYSSGTRVLECVFTRILEYMCIRLLEYSSTCILDYMSTRLLAKRILVHSSTRIYEYLSNRVHEYFAE
jgi:plasmid replication initiation protein